MGRTIDMDRILLIGIGSIMLILVVTVAVQKNIAFYEQEKDFVRNEVKGVLLSVENRGRGNYLLMIKQSKDTAKYSLAIGYFIEENNITANDSISKEANDHTIIFYKKKDGVYERASEWEYY